jgi:hypothetical protein
MKRLDIRAAVDEELARFEAEVRNLAFAIARAVLRQELESKPLQLELSALRPRTAQQPKAQAERRSRSPAARVPEPEPKAPRRKRADVQQAESQPEAEATPQLELHLANAAGAAEVVAPPAPAAPEPPPPPPPPSTEGRQRVQWTRESIINELATWVSSGTAIDAAFMARHGPRGLVAAARKIFGRFEAAMNLTALHLSKVSAENPPSGEPS